MKNEKLKAEPELLSMVARLGNGSMRDALSIMDRLMASGEKKLTTELLEGLMGMAPRELVGKLIDAFADGEPSPALEAAGHWGVPTMVYEGEPFFGQDRIETLRWRLEKAGLRRV